MAESVVVWEPENEEQLHDLTCYAEWLGQMLHIRDWEDCLHDAFLYLLQRPHRNGHTLWYVCKIILDKFHDQQGCWWNRKVDYLEDMPTEIKRRLIGDSIIAV